MQGKSSWRSFVLHKTTASFSLATIWYPFSKIVVCMCSRDEFTIKRETTLTHMLVSYMRHMKEFVCKRSVTVKTERDYAAGSGKLKQTWVSHSLPLPTSTVIRFEPKSILAHYIGYWTSRIITSHPFATFEVLDAFARLRKVTTSFLMSVCLSVCLFVSVRPRGTTRRFPMDEFSWHLIFECFLKMLRKFKFY
jgi:hypothetical protein